jgi:uncharacterized protein
MFDAQEFDRVLSKVIKAEPGIKKVILVDRTGLTVAHVSRFSDYVLEVDTIGVISSAIFGASEEQGSNLSIGALEVVISEFLQGKIFATSCGRGVLCVVTESDVNLGIIRLVMRKASEDLTDKLEEFLAGQSVISATPEKADESVSMRKDELEAALKELERF